MFRFVITFSQFILMVKDHMWGPFPKMWEWTQRPNCLSPFYFLKMTRAWSFTLHITFCSEVFSFWLALPWFLKMHELSLFFFLAFIIQTENGYGFLSIERRVKCFIIQLQETFHPPTWGLFSWFQTSKEKVMSGNHCPLAGYLVHNLHPWPVSPWKSPWTWQW